MALRKQFDEEYQFDETRIYIENAVYDEGLYLNFFLDDHIRLNGYHSKRKIAYLNDEEEGELFLNFYLDEEEPTDDFTIYVAEAVFQTSNEEQYGKITEFTRLFTLPGFKFSIVRH